MIHCPFKVNDSSSQNYLSAPSQGGTGGEKPSHRRYLGGTLFPQGLASSFILRGKIPQDMTPMRQSAERKLVFAPVVL